MTFTFPNGTTSCEFGAVMGATEKPRSAVAWCRAKWMRIAPLLHSTEQTKDAERWRPRAGDKLLEVKSLAFKPGHLDVGRWRERKIGVDHCNALAWDKEQNEFYIQYLYVESYIDASTSTKPNGTQTMATYQWRSKKHLYKTSVQETIDADIATIPTSHLQRVSKWPCRCWDLNLNMT